MNRVLFIALALLTATKVLRVVTPEPGTDMVLLVHHPRGHQPPAGADEHHRTHGAAEH